MTLENLGIGDAAIVAILGYAVVFFGLVLLMVVVIIMGKIFMSLNQKQAQAPAAAAVPDKPAAPGAAGELKLHDVEPKTAALLMAIVADKMGKPLNELRFKSIKEVK